MPRPHVVVVGFIPVPWCANYPQIGLRAVSHVLGRYLSVPCPMITIVPRPDPPVTSAPCPRCHPCHGPCATLHISRQLSLQRPALVLHHAKALYVSLACNWRAVTHAFLQPSHGHARCRRQPRVGLVSCHVDGRGTRRVRCTFLHAFVQIQCFVVVVRYCFGVFVHCSWRCACSLARACAALPRIRRFVDGSSGVRDGWPVLAGSSPRPGALAVACHW